MMIMMIMIMMIMIVMIIIMITIIVIFIIIIMYVHIYIYIYMLCANNKEIQVLPRKESQALERSLYLNLAQGRPAARQTGM